MKYLAGVCDGAVEQDGVGFAKGDSYNGMYLAALPLSKWGDDEVSLAKHYATKYRGQVSGIIEVQYEAETEVRERVSYSRRKAYNKPMAVATYENGLIVTNTPYNANFVADSKKIPSRRYGGDTFNNFRPEHLKEVLELCEKYEVELLFNPADVVIPTTTTVAPVKPPEVKKKVVVEGKKLAVYFPYSPETVAFIKSLGIAGWNKDKKCWEIEPVHAQKVIDNFGDFEIDPSIFNLAHQSVENRKNFNKDVTSYSVPLPMLLPEYTVLPHQWVPIEQAVTKGHILNADSQGLGKTFSSLITMIIAKAKRNVVIAPASLTENWKNESQMFFTEGTFTPFMAQGRTPTEIPEDADLVILSWDVFSFWADTLTAWNPETIVVDEAHYGKSGKGSKRGATFIDFGKKNKKAIKMALTGTPILNRPLELLAILQFFLIEKMFGGVTKFKNRYCGPKAVETPYGTAWTYNGAENLDELNEILTSSGVYIRRTKKLLMDQGLLKSKYVNGVEFFSYDIKRTPTYVTLNDKEQASYDAVEQEFKDGLKQQLAQTALEMGLSVNHPKVKNAVTSNKSGEALVLLNNFRKRIGELKVRAITEYIQNLVNNGEKVVVGAHHREVVDAYAAAFSGIKIQGGMGVKKIEQAKYLFNATPLEENPVLSVSMEAGKTGHTLCLQMKYGVGQECAYLIMAEEPYVYGDAEQFEDRIYRIGQSRDVFILNLIVRNTVDERIYGIREAKRRVFNAVIDGVNLEEDEEESVAKQILKDYI